MTVPTVERMARVIIRKIASFSELKNSTRASPNSLKLNDFASSVRFVMACIAFVAGEISTKAYVEIPDIIRETIRQIGYTDAAWGFDYHTCSVITSIHNQSPDIAVGVDSGGAGDQGLMFGYASNETPELMPMPIVLAHRLTRRLAEVRKKSLLPWTRPDGKSQVTVEYRNGRPVRVDTIVVSTQHSPDVTSKKIDGG